MTEPTYTIRPSRVLQKLRAGEIAYATKLNLGDLGAVDSLYSDKTGRAGGFS